MVEGATTGAGEVFVDKASGVTSSFELNPSHVQFLSRTVGSELYKNVTWFHGATSYWFSNSMTCRSLQW